MLVLDSIEVRYGANIILQDINIDIKKGETVALLGPSGCGKTTTLRVIAGFQRASKGRVLIDGVDQSNSRPYERNIGVVFQDYSLFPHLTVGENVAFGPVCRGWPRDKVSAAVRSQLEMVKLPDLDARLPATLSGGQQQRVALARALATNPQILLLDEPLSALDASLRQQLRYELRDLLRSINTTTIIVTHDQEEAFGLADKVFLMRSGVVVQQGNASQLYEHPVDEFAARFIGRGSLIAGSVIEKSGRQKFVSESGITIDLEGQNAKMGTCKLFIRPESVAIVPGNQNNGEATRNLIRARVGDISNLGHKSEAIVTIGPGEDLIVDVDNILSKRISPNEMVDISISSAGLVILPR